MCGNWKVELCFAWNKLSYLNDISLELSLHYFKFSFSLPYLSLLLCFPWKVLIKQEIQRKSGYAIQVDEEHLRVQLDTIQSELNAPTQFKASVLKLWLHSAMFFQTIRVAMKYFCNQVFYQFSID